MNKASVALVALGCWAGLAYAQAEWEAVTYSNAGAVYYIDTASMKTDSFGGTEVWVKTTFKKPQKARNGKLYVEIFTRSTYHCGRLSSTDDATYARDKQGNVVASAQYGAESPIIPDSIGSFLYNRVCPKE